jgi:hypothetical protein
MMMHNLHTDTLGHAMVHLPKHAFERGQLLAAAAAWRGHRDST